MIDRIDEAARFVLDRIGARPRVGVILGSGLGGAVERMEVTAELSYSEIPHAPQSGVTGHSGRLVAARHGDEPVVVLQGRVHHYEGWEMSEVTFLARVLIRLGIEGALITNAAGGINVEFSPGDLMMISDHINMFGVNPLRGVNIDELGVRFPDMSDAYSETLRTAVGRRAAERGLALKEGVYVGVSGPSYETPAEIRAFRSMGGDAVGMSTVPEVIAMAHAEVPVVGISCITNMAAGILPRKLTHEEVIETTKRVEQDFVTVSEIVLDSLIEKGDRKLT